MPDGKSVVAVQKNKTWTIPAVLGLILGILGAVGIIELRPQITVSPEEQIEKSQPFSAPFRILNSGYLSVRVDHIYCYAKEVVAGPVSVGPATFESEGWKDFELERGEPKTVICRILRTNSEITKADIAIVVDVQPFSWICWIPRRYFRFVGAHVDIWRWTGQPAAPIKKEADEAISKIKRPISK